MLHSNQHMDNQYNNQYNNQYDDHFMIESDSPPPYEQVPAPTIIQTNNINDEYSRTSPEMDAVMEARNLLENDLQKEIFDMLVIMYKNRTYDERTIKILHNNMLNEEIRINFDAACDFDVCPEIFKKFTWVEYVEIINVHLSRIENIPTSVKFLSFTRNNITTVPGNMLHIGLTKLSLADNNISCIDFKVFPLTLKQLDISKNVLETIFNPAYLTNLEILILSDNKMKSIPKFNDSLQKLDISNNDIRKLENCPFDLTDLDCSECNLTDLSGVPKKLTKLIAYSNQFKYIISLPEHLKECDLSLNKISYLGKIPKDMLNFDVSNNEIAEFKQETPKTMLKLNISHNKISKQKIKEIQKKNSHIVNLIVDKDDDKDNNNNNNNNNNSDNDDMTSTYKLFDDNTNTNISNYWGNLRNGHTLGIEHPVKQNKYGHTYYNYKYTPAYDPPKYKSYMAHNESNPYYIIHKREVKL